jgi:ppGpp synthetase/RelA/SpoT-type nucleotidyltranferase
MKRKTNEYGFVNSNEEYEVRYAKNKQREGYKGRKYAGGGGASGSPEIHILNEGEKFDKSRYKTIFGDFDHDGIENLDDPNPTRKGDTRSVEERRITDSIAQLLDIKNNLDSTMYTAVGDIAKLSPKDAVIYARTKTPYSIIQKLIGKRLLVPKDPKKGLTDLIGMTIAVDNFADLTKLRKVIESGKIFNVYEVEDFYKNPLDGYMAVHYILLFKDDKGTFPVELQLKTKRMKAVNEVSHKAYAQHNLDRDELLKVTSIVEKADKGNATAIKQYNALISDKAKLEDSFFKDKAKKYSGGGDVEKEEWTEIGKENNRMLRNQVREVAHHSHEINSTVGKNTKVEPWVVAKMERASTDLSDVTHYLDGEKYAGGGDIDTKDFTNLPLGTRINAFIERRDKDFKGKIIEKTPSGYRIETHDYDSYPVTYDEVTRVMSFPQKPESMNQPRKRFLGLFDKGGLVFTDKADGTMYSVEQNSKGQWTVFSQGPRWKKRDEFESGLASKEDAVMLAKVMANVTDEFSPETNVPSYKYAGGGNTDSRLVDAERYGYSIQYFDETDPAFDVEYANDEYVIRVVGGGDYDDYSVSITQGDYNVDAVTFVNIKDANKFVIDFMKDNEESRDFMGLETMRYGGDVVRHFKMAKRYVLGGPMGADSDMTEVQKFFFNLDYNSLPPAFFDYVKNEILNDPELAYLSAKEPIFIEIKQKVNALLNKDETEVEVVETTDSNTETQEAIDLLMELSEDQEGAEKRETLEAIELLKELLV